MQTTEVRFPMGPLMELFERQADAADFWEVDVRRVRGVGADRRVLGVRLHHV